MSEEHEYGCDAPDRISVLQTENDNLKTQLIELQSQIETLTIQNQQLQEVAGRLNAENEQNKRTINTLNYAYEKLVNEQQQFMRQLGGVQ